MDKFGPKKRSTPPQDIVFIFDPIKLIRKKLFNTIICRLLKAKGNFFQTLFLYRLNKQKFAVKIKHLEIKWVIS